MGKQVPVDTAARFHARTHWYVRETILYSIRLEMGSQCSDHRPGGQHALARELVLVTMRAAVSFVGGRFNSLAARPHRALLY